MAGRVPPLLTTPPGAAAVPRTGLFETGVAYLGIVYYEQGIFSSLRYARGGSALKPTETDILSTVVQVAILAFVIVVLLMRRRDYARLFRPMAPYFAILLLCLASTLWSDNPIVSFRRSISLAACILLGVTLFQSFGLPRLIEMVGRSCVCLAVLSLIVIAAVPSVGRDVVPGYDWAMRGVFPQKNSMGECMVLGIACYAARVVGRRSLDRPTAAALSLLSLCGVLSQSVTSMLVAAVILVIAAHSCLQRFTALRVGLTVVLLWSAVACAVLILLYPGSLEALTGRDASITGRAPLWVASLGVIARRPLIGYGYCGFWNENSIEVQYIWQRIGWQAPSAHNGVLDVLIQLGVAGLLLYAWVWARVIRLTVAALFHGALPSAGWIAFFMIINVVLNVDEGLLPSADEFSLLMPCVLLTLSQWEQNRRTPHRWHRLTDATAHLRSA